MNDLTLRQDARVIGLVGLAHGVSHFYHLILAALFVWLKPAFDLSYAELGMLMTVFFIISGIGQALAGFVVDRFGARAVLFSGISLLGLSALLLASAHSYGMLMAGAMLAGVGNSVFHPADYTLLSQRVSAARLAHGFSVHGISGNIGWALSPLFMTFVATRSDWRTALLCAAVLPFAVLLILFLNRHALRPDPLAVHQSVAAGGNTLDFLRLPSVWMCFAFFFITAIALGGIQSFATVALVKLYDMSLALATSAYTAYMLASAVGMAFGGFVGARSQRHDRNIALAFAVAALLAVLLAFAAVPAWAALVLMGAIGLASGVAGPSRDLMIRAAAPKNATGRVYGVVYSGLDSGLAVGPLLFGALMDGNHPSLVFILIGAFQALAIATAVGVGGNTRARQLA
ncbi:MFS transporter [Janthinobacterium agaricidamnosum]|uniref:Major Facilitator Superfamily protein n=1 Tax=Janthinobacterium agaricidamnosum NBRC 102515 = DSM 9628 TaxID=1349767 RepID=W0V4X3_9BURK|nr:MFS transporter [Janthinobacterium agaricidamnosum]CDG83879.1 major Facilitator Superfamily protein [Janthinobacterium agaricidamnosum NBRC 102515 = DSM 9628]